MAGGRRGPAPKPSALRKLQGNPAKRALNPREPTPPAADAKEIRRPRWIRARTRAAAHWDELVERLTGMKVLTRADETALALLCDALAELRECVDQVRREGRTYESVRVEEKTICSECGAMGDEHTPACSGEAEKQTVQIVRRIMRAHPLLPTIGTLRTHITRMLQEFGLTASARARVSASEEEPADDAIDELLKRKGA